MPACRGNLERALETLKAQGAQLIDQVPKQWAGGAKIAFDSGPVGWQGTAPNSTR